MGVRRFGSLLFIFKYHRYPMFNRRVFSLPVIIHFDVFKDTGFCQAPIHIPFLVNQFDFQGRKESLRDRKESPGPTPNDHFAWGAGAIGEPGRGDNPPEIFTAVDVAGTDSWGVFSSGSFVA